MKQHSLIQKLLSRIPNHPKADAVLKERKQLNYFHVSTQVKTFIRNGVEYQTVVGVTYIK